MSGLISIVAIHKIDFQFVVGVIYCLNLEHHRLCINNLSDKISLQEPIYTCAMLLRAHFLPHEEGNEGCWAGYQIKFYDY